MSDPIDREALMRKFTTFVKAHGDSEPAPTWNDAVSLVGSMPSARPEQKRGKWIDDKGLYRCSSCNQLWTEWWAASKPIERMEKECPYCPMCGSYNGEENENG